MFEPGRNGQGDRRAWKGAVAGVAGGLVAAWIMNQFQAGLSKASHTLTSRDGEEPGGVQSSGQAEGEDATGKAANAISEAVLDRKLTAREKAAAGPLIHYLFGSAVGCVYGVAAELAPATAIGWGLPFGSAVWIGADEVAVPAAGLSKSPSNYPPSTHISALAAHLVYGAATDLVRRAVRAAL
jgi:putative membrane protein